MTINIVIDFVIRQYQVVKMNYAGSPAFRLCRPLTLGVADQAINKKMFKPFTHHINGVLSLHQRPIFFILCFLVTSWNCGVGKIYNWLHWMDLALLFGHSLGSWKYLIFKLTFANSARMPSTMQIDSIMFFFTISIRIQFTPNIGITASCEFLSERRRNVTQNCFCVNNDSDVNNNCTWIEPKSEIYVSSRLSIYLVS